MSRLQWRTTGAAVSVLIAAGIGITTNVVTARWSWAWGSGLVALILSAVAIQVGLSLAEERGNPQAASPAPAKATNATIGGDGRITVGMTGLQVVLTLAVFGFFALCLVVWTVPGRRDGSGSGAPAALPSSLPARAHSASPNLDLCILGTWRETVFRTIAEVNGKSAYLGLNENGSLFTFNADGVMTEVAEDRVLHADVGDDSWDYHYTYTLAFTFRTRQGGKISLVNTAHDGANTVFRNGVQVGGSKPNGSIRAESYECTSDTLQLSGPDSAFSIDLKRISN
jgi:hypothetical protein